MSSKTQLSPKLNTCAESARMKNLIVVLSLLLTTGLAAFAQTDGRVRPRVAPTPTPPVLRNDPQPAATPDRAPVLIGGSNSRPVPTATVKPGDDEVIKVETNLVTMPVSVLDRDG